MPGEDQERVEDYLELERYIEELQAGHAAQLPEHLTPEKARVYRMAALFHSATPEAVEPHSAFAEQLEARLLAQLQSPSQQDALTITDAPANKEQHNGSVPPVVPQTLEMPASEQANEQHPLLPPSPIPHHTSRAGRLSRRNMLAGAASVAASLGIGAGVGYTIEHTVIAENAATTEPTTTANKFVWDPKIPLVGNVPTTWLEVASLAQLGNGAVRFVTDALVGYVVHLTTSNEIIAVSAACTHMGCLVQWQHADRRFHCPCHSGLFEASGEQVENPDYAYTLAPLPRLRTKVENGHVYVEVPVKQQSEKR